MRSARKLLFATGSLALRRLAWLGTAVTLSIGATPAFPTMAETATDHPPAVKSIRAVRERIAQDGKGARKPVFYRLSQFFNFPNFPNFNNSNFNNFPNFPNFPKF